MDQDLKEHLISQSLEGIVVTETDGSILACNETARRILGLKDANLEGGHIGILFPSASIGYLLPNLIRIAVQESGFEGEILLQYAENDPVMVRLHAEGYPSHAARRILFRFLDWRETMEITRQLRESNQMALLGDLTRSMAHEILNPLSVVGAFTRRLIRAQPENSENEEWARQVILGVERLESLIENLRNYLDLPSPRFSPGNPGEILDQVMEFYREDAKTHGIRLLEEGPERLPEIYMDPDLIETAIGAALGNSILRMPRGGDLIVTKKLTGDHVIITVEDSGPSLDTRQMLEDLSPIHVIGGDRSHLNLAIARRIVDEHSGLFRLGSSDRGGIKVEISLPVDRRTLVRSRSL